MHLGAMIRIDHFLVTAHQDVVAGFPKCHVPHIVRIDVIYAARLEHDILPPPSTSRTVSSSHSLAWTGVDKVTAAAKRSFFMVPCLTLASYYPIGNATAFHRASLSDAAKISAIFCLALTRLAVSRRNCGDEPRDMRAALHVEIPHRGLALLRRAQWDGGTAKA